MLPSTTKLDRSLRKKLPFDVREEYEYLPKEAQKQFKKLFKKKAKSTSTAHIFHLLGSHYLYTGNLFMQLFFWFSLGGGGLWWLIDLFNMDNLLKNVNEDIARECMLEVKKNYGLSRKLAQAPNAPQLPEAHFPFAPKTPRDLNIPYDASNLTIENLQLNYLVDYNSSTWRVLHVRQYDWLDGQSEREFHLTNENKIQILTQSKSHNTLRLNIAEEINIYRIDTNLDNHIIEHKEPPKVLQYEGVSYYRERKKEGYYFDLSKDEHGKAVIDWDYYDAEKSKYISIEKVGKKEFRAIYGTQVNVNRFMQILPAG